MDDLDATLLHLFAAEPRIGVLEASRRLGVARGTVQARLDKLLADHDELVIVAPDGKPGCGIENRLGPSPRKFPKNNGPNPLKTRPFAAPVAE